MEDLKKWIVEQKTKIIIIVIALILLLIISKMLKKEKVVETSTTPSPKEKTGWNADPLPEANAPEMDLYSSDFMDEEMMEEP
ncbi:MAG: hypothetical protein IJ867_07520 [Clostridia bacterium]|nr:hypothetical protein [Clostridia bacterium]